MVWIGTVSYSAYVWQEIFMTRPGASLSPFGFLAYFPFNLICVFAVSALSYYLIERPFIEQGRRLLARRREGVAATSNA
jgi:peptidoglycan/LPS O-acetylase OafA/YrhL